VRSTQAVPEKLFQSGGGYIDFTLPRLTKKIDELTLSMTIKNPSVTAAINMLPNVVTITHVEYFSGTSFLMTSDFMAIRTKELMTQTSDKHLATSKYSNVRIDPATGGALTFDASINPLEQRTVFLSLTGCFHGLIPGFLNEDLRLRVHFADDKVFSSAESGLLLTSATVLLETCVLQEAELAEVEAVYRSNKLSIRYFEPRVQRIPVSLAASGTYQVNLQNFFGNFVSLWVMLQYQSGVTADAISTLEELETLWITDASNQTMFGGLIHSKDWLRYSASRYYPSACLGNAHIYAFNASMHPAQDIVTGSHGGSFALHAKGESLNFTTASTMGSHDRQVTIIGWHASCLRVQNGNIVALR